MEQPLEPAIHKRYRGNLGVIVVRASATSQFVFCESYDTIALADRKVRSYDSQYNPIVFRGVNKDGKFLIQSACEYRNLQGQKPDFSSLLID